jgi:HPt (histidine-containing phosphotransfer) domain-containing protein
MQQRYAMSEKKNSKDDKIIVWVDPDLLDIIPAFLQNRKEDICSILEALEIEDYETIRILGHSMKGSGGGYGFHVITDIGRSLEEAAKKKDDDEIKKWIGELSHYLERVRWFADSSAP